MAKQGSPALVTPAAGALRVAILAARWHEEIMSGLLNGARAALADSGLPEPVVVRVPGTFELTVAARRAADLGYDALVCLGVVIRGDTPHFDYICASATQGLTEVSARTGVPIGFGVLTCDDVEQARLRAGLPDSKEDKGHEAALAAVTTALALRQLPPAS